MVEPPPKTYTRGAPSMSIDESFMLGTRLVAPLCASRKVRGSPEWVLANRWQSLTDWLTSNSKKA
ncbi:MAG: hypothetical protein Q8P67_09115 [archaeon]|nr:hypothetical protein [archaeon]